MKSGKVFRVLAIAFTLALLLMMIPVAPALAQSMTLNTSEGLIGSHVLVNGSGYIASSNLSVYFSSDRAEVSQTLSALLSYKLVSTLQTDSGGAIYTASFAVPARLDLGTTPKDVTSGQYYVYITYQSESVIRARAYFSVAAPQINLNPERAAVGTPVEVTGANFGSNEPLLVKYDNTDMTSDVGKPVTASDGKFKFVLTIPLSVTDNHTIRVTGASTGRIAEGTFYVQPRISCNPSSGPGNTRLQVTGTGFGAYASVTVTFAAIKLIDTQTNEEGSFTVVVNAPVVGPDNYDIVARDGPGSSAKVTFSVITETSISPATSASSPGFAGQQLTFSGSGFTPQGTLTITYFDVTKTSTATIDPTGHFSTTFAVPKSKSGQHIITIGDGKNTKEFTFTMEATPPSTPTLSKPEMGTKVDPRAYFVWQAVTDTSGVTYTLQIASDKDFNSIVLEKKGLTSSEYALTEAEILKSVSQQSPYYWRIKAVDGAFNESGWSSASTFYVGFVLALPQWWLYAMIGVGFVLLFGLGFWLGRKTVPY